ncbi:ORF075 [Saltwater crocodilepox virus]|nr:hypothetical protein [Saltwater crocodilepox virus]AVD69410.1 hypothetical protein [Saltwater crocodilepox virus]QGT46514.1 ORF075 [Saltwater crocodilepox virus]QGT46730.1 ORF075 [Saltwater crocodilepox virus]QGT46947.1 ORF075 [Saltwater crocodilepox virus]
MPLSALFFISVLKLRRREVLAAVFAHVLDGGLLVGGARLRDHRHGVGRAAVDAGRVALVAEHAEVLVVVVVLQPLQVVLDAGVEALEPVQEVPQQVPVLAVRLLDGRRQRVVALVPRRDNGLVAVRQAVLRVLAVLDAEIIDRGELCLLDVDLGVDDVSQIINIGRVTGPRVELLELLVVPHELAQRLLVHGDHTTQVPAAHAGQRPRLSALGLREQDR